MTTNGLGPHRTAQEAACWRESKNWFCCGLVYSCKDDARVWVPKNEGPYHYLQGSTLNMARGEGRAYLLATGALLAWAVVGTARDRR